MLGKIVEHKEPVISHSTSERVECPNLRCNETWNGFPSRVYCECGARFNIEYSDFFIVEGDIPPESH